MLRERFGEDVLAIVEGLTDTDQIPKPPWRARKEAYIAHLAEASPSVLLVSLADKIHNVSAILRDYRAVGDAVWERFSGRRDGTLWYYRALATTFQAYGDTPIIKEFDRLVTELEHLANSQ